MLAYGPLALSSATESQDVQSDTNEGHRFFKSKFHCFDAAVILAGFIVDVCLKGVLEEAGSIIVILRLWRVFKIIEELSAGAEEQMDSLSVRIEQLEKENEELRKELRTATADETPT